MPDTVASKVASAAAGRPARFSAEHLAADCRGGDFWQMDRGLRDLLGLYLDAEWQALAMPHLARLGQLAGTRLDELAALADRHGPVLHARDRFGRDEDWIEYHPAYREMERIAYGEFGMHAMSHRGGVLGMPTAVPPLVKYAFTYLFVQAEFGLMCPISMSDTSNYTIGSFASPALKRRVFDRMLSQDLSILIKGAQLMTEKAGGSDVGAIETEAEPLAVDGDGVERWRIHGQKWFCSHADADIAVLLARPRGAVAGSAGLGLFAMPRRLPDGQRNRYRIVRLKDKLGTRSMASGEITLEGAEAWLVGDVGRGFKQMMQQVNLSRLSHGVRAAAMMRRCLNEALAAAASRRAFGRAIAEFPLLRRQLMKIMIPTEQALSMYGFCAWAMGRADRGDADAQALVRILTPIYKFRACRDNIRVASHALEVRGGNGYIEDWVEARLVRDAQIGTLWEGTSNINALDVVQRAVGRAGAQTVLSQALVERLSDAPAIPGQFRGALGAALDRAVRFAEAVASSTRHEKRARAAAGALYHAASAIVLAWEGAQLGARGGDARRLLLARMVLEHRLEAQDPLSLRDDGWEDRACELLLGSAPVSIADAGALVTA